MSNLIQVYFDGGCIPNPGNGYGSYEIVSDRLNHKAIRQQFGSNMTNNMAEYRALIAALKWLRHHTDKSERLMIYTDSNLIRQQLTGKALVKVIHLKELFIETMQLLLCYKDWRIEWRGRSANVKRFGH